MEEREKVESKTKLRKWINEDKLKTVKMNAKNSGINAPIEIVHRELVNEFANESKSPLELIGKVKQWKREKGITYRG